MTIPVGLPSNRIESFRLWLADALPVVDRKKPQRALQAKADLRTFDITKLMVIYLTWRARMVVPSVRKVVFAPSLTEDPRWPQYQAAVMAFAEQVGRGEDLSPHLSRLVTEQAYWPDPPPPPQASASVTRWKDKDFILTVMGFHHFHFALTMDASGHATRGSVVLFASVSADTFEILGLFDHGVFRMTDGGAMTAERERVWQLHETKLFEGLGPGDVVIGNMVSTSGHSTRLVMRAQRIIKVLRSMDPLLDTPGYFQTKQADLPLLTDPSWIMVHDRLAVLEGNTAIPINGI